METWKCPNCELVCEYGKKGCDNPHGCDQPKNINYKMVYCKLNLQSGKSIGIAEIANQEMKDETKR